MNMYTNLTNMIVSKHKRYIPDGDDWDALMVIRDRLKEPWIFFVEHKYGKSESGDLWVSAKLVKCNHRKAFKNHVVQLGLNGKRYTKSDYTQERLDWYFDEDTQKYLWDFLTDHWSDVCFDGLY